LASTLLDEFVVAHALGWWAKALVVRNTALLWAGSIGFELLERSFKVWWRGGEALGAGVGGAMRAAKQE
jgi:hypothetical protein